VEFGRGGGMGCAGYVGRGNNIVSYKQIHETFWTDPDVKKYKPMVRYLFAYLITGPHAHYSGIYYLPLVYIENETGLSKKDIEAHLSFLQEKGHVIYDHHREVVFVKSEMIYQSDNQRDGRVILNEKHITGIKKHFTTLHKSPLIANWLETYAYLNIEYTAIDTPIGRGMDTDSVPVPVPVPVPVLVEGYGEKGKDEKNIIPPKLEWVERYCTERKNGISPGVFIDHYTTNGWKVGKAATPMKDWQAAVRTWEEQRKNGGSNGHRPTGITNQVGKDTSGTWDNQPYPVDLVVTE
jgi:hypothetical protein